MFVVVWASWLTSLASLGLLAWLGFQRRRLENWVSWLPVPLLPALIAIGWGNPVWILVSNSVLLCYCLFGARLAFRRGRMARDFEQGS